MEKIRIEDKTQRFFSDANIRDDDSFLHAYIDEVISLQDISASIRCFEDLCKQL